MMVGQRERRRVRDAEDARALLSRWEESGEGLGEWCARHGVVRQSLQWWRGRADVVGTAPVLRIAEVMMSGSSLRAEYRVVLTNGREVRVDEAFDGAVLARLLDVVDR